MIILPLDPSANATPEALRAFLGQCRAAAAGDGRPRLVSISLEVEPLDPLAVLESIFEPGELHFYAERPAEGWALAGAEAVLAFEARGPERFAACQRFIDDVLDRTIAVGGVRAAVHRAAFPRGLYFPRRRGGGRALSGRRACLCRAGRWRARRSAPSPWPTCSSNPPAISTR